jgi:glycosyltransferase involved in cell wall biosynthesis
MNWFVLSMFRTDDWIPSYVRSSDHRFRSIAAAYTHDRSRANATLRDWIDYLRHGLSAWRAANASPGRSGFITVFPQLSLVVGLFKRLTGSRRPVIAWMFNVNRAYGGARGYAARLAVYSRWLDLPVERFVFVPLSVARHPITETEDTAAPFLLSMGTANRDYALLLQVLARVPYRAIVVAGPHALAGLTVPANVEVRSGLSEAACRALCQRARLCVVPLKNIETAAGQVTVLEAMMAGRPVIATRSAGTVDYVEHDVDGLLVPQGDEAALGAAIERLWNSDDLRGAIGTAAQHAAATRFTFQAVAAHLERLVGELATPQAGDHPAA